MAAAEVIALSVGRILLHASRAIPTLSHSSHIYIAFLVHSFTINSVLHFSFHITHVRDPKYADKLGAVAIVPTGISSNRNECAAFENGGNSVDTSALLVSITPAGTIPARTPGLITSTGDGGVFETYISANSTDGSGNVHWSWRSVSASSSSWWAIYGTSWACTRTIEQAIMQQPPTRVPVTLTSALITTIINGVTTTNISGSSTQIIIGDSGVIPPTNVPASTANAASSINFLSDGMQTLTAASGIITPTGIAASSMGANISVSQGSAQVTISGGTAIYFSTGDQGVIPPPPSTSVSLGPAAGSLANPNVTASAGSAQFTASGATFTYTSTGDEGVILPAPTGGLSIFTISCSTYTINPTGVNGAIGPQTTNANSTFTIGAIVTISGLPSRLSRRVLKV
jgi:hypothetical protein